MANDTLARALALSAMSGGTPGPMGPTGPQGPMGPTGPAGEDGGGPLNNTVPTVGFIPGKDDGKVLVAGPIGPRWETSVNPTYTEFWVEPASNGYLGFSYNEAITEDKNIQYSTDRTNWTSTTMFALQQSFIAITANTKTYLKSNDTNVISKGVNGDWCSLLVKDSNAPDGANIEFNVGGCMKSLFNDNDNAGSNIANLFMNTWVVDASALVLQKWNNNPPQHQRPYDKAFCDCSHLQYPPCFPSDTAQCYWSAEAFRNCTALRAIPRFHGNIMGFWTFWSAFNGCTSLKVSETRTNECRYLYPIPAEGYIAPNTDPAALSDFFTNTSGSFTGTPDFNKCYYVNLPVIG